MSSQTSENGDTGKNGLAWSLEPSMELGAVDHPMMPRMLGITPIDLTLTEYLR